MLTLHTVLSVPSVGQAETLRALCDLSTLVCVFTETARRMVLDARLVRPERVRVVPHGGPTELLPKGNGRRRLRLPRRHADEPARSIDEDRCVLATFGLISPGKGIETAIEAMPAIVERHPKAVYVVAGQTHPEVAKQHGEEYRLSLERLARDLDLGEHVIFDDRFLTVEDLCGDAGSHHDLPHPLPLPRADRVGRADLRDRGGAAHGLDALTSTPRTCWARAPA